MARMIPSPISPDTHPASREEEFYQRFARELPEDWTVYHGLGLITPDIQKREVDFLIVAPQGIVCLELKNTRFKYEQETWYRLARDLNRWFPFKKANYRNPVEQSQSALEELLDFLDNHNSGRPPVPRRSYCSATFLLQNRRKELADALKDLSLDGAARNVRFADELEGDLLSILQDMTGQNALKSVSETERQKLHDILVMNLNLVEPFSRRKARQEEDLMRMTRQQYGVLRRFERNGRVLLRGVAGSGKTLIALEGARRLARRGKRVLLLCYSSNLANHLASSTADEPNIHASTMNGFCRSIILEKDPEFGKRRDDSDVLRKEWDRDFESQVLPEKALTSLPSDFPAYDTLVLDEGQDLFSIENIFFLDRVLKGGLETGNWLITYDPGQNLRGDMAHALQHLKDTGPRFQHLQRNIRTPGRVYEWIRKITGHSSSAELSDVTDIQLVEYDDPEDGLMRLEYTLNYAIQDLGYPAHEVMVLSPENMKNTETVQQRRSFGEHSLQTVKDGRPVTGKVGFSRIHQFKGLECSFVILTGIEDYRDPAMRNQIYVALTRTTGAAAILYPRSNRSFFRGL